MSFSVSELKLTNSLFSDTESGNYINWPSQRDRNKMMEEDFPLGLEIVQFILFSKWLIFIKQLIFKYNFSLQLQIAVRNPNFKPRLVVLFTIQEIDISFEFDSLLFFKIFI